MLKYKKLFTLRTFQIAPKLCRTYSDACAQLDVKKGVVLGCFENELGELTLTPAACKFNEKMQGKLMELIKNSGRPLQKARQSLPLRNIETDYWTVAVVGLGKLNAGFNSLEAICESRENVRFAAGIGCQYLLRDRCSHIFVEGLGRPEQAAEGAALAIWRYQDFKERTKRLPVPLLELYEDVDHEGWQRGLFKAEAQNVARRLADIPANHLTPTSLAQEAVKVLCPCGIKVMIHDKEWITNNKMNALLMTARGSCEPPILLEMQYCGASVDEKPICLVGKGVTFDSGGLCHRRCKHMKYAAADCVGATIIIAVIRACAMLSLPVNVYGLMPLYEHMLSGMAVRCGDLVKMLNGKTVEIESTDCEGRLLIADTMYYSQVEYMPKLLVDITSMTVGVENLLGSAATGTFSNSEQMWKEIRKAGIVSGDRMWRLPLWKFYRRKVGCYTYVDINNLGTVGPERAEPCLAAAFLANFVDCVDWLHLDVFGTAKNSQEEHCCFPYLTDNYSTARTVRTLIQFIYQLACPNECDQM